MNPRSRLHRSSASLSNGRQAMLAVLWLALFAQWMTVVPVILPDQVAGLLGADQGNKEGIIGSVLGAGAFIALVVSPIAGAWSDRWRGARGRRRPFLVLGTLGSCAGLAWLASFGPGDSLALYTLAFLNLQFWWNCAAGPYAGLIPDVVSKDQHATASGWINVMSVLGTITGNAVLALCYRQGQPMIAILGFIALNLTCLLMTLVGAPEQPALAPLPPVSGRAWLRGFWLDPRTHRNFYWVLLTRLLANMGIWSSATAPPSWYESPVGSWRWPLPPMF